MQKHQELLPHLFRQEYAKIIAVLCRQFGILHIEVAEDIASEAFLKAADHWALNGTPENPCAWLYTVAKNKAKDLLKHISIFENKVQHDLISLMPDKEAGFEFNEQIIADSTLAMIFAVCNPLNSKDGQICLALQILCGFSVEEIADALLSKKETIKKRLLRARAILRNGTFAIKPLKESDISSRLNIVLKALYLLFNEGYFSRSNNKLIRKDLCLEALKLTLVLTEHELTNTPDVNALLSLMCYQSSRLDARTGNGGEKILFNEQNKKLWDDDLIHKGNYYLVCAFTGDSASTYHLEAAIAYWHTTNDKDKWHHILDLYNQLIDIDSSPTIALNRLFAVFNVNGIDAAIAEAEFLDIKKNNHYHQLLAFLYTKKYPSKALKHYEQAISITKSKIERQMLRKKMLALQIENDQQPIVLGLRTNIQYDDPVTGSSTLSSVS